jgi:hypothetical protein
MKNLGTGSKGSTLHLLGFLFFCLASCVYGWSQARIVDIANDANDPNNLEDSEPSIAVNPQNPMEIVIVSFSEPWGAATSAPVWKSRDGGFTWNKITQIGAPTGALAGPGDQKIDFDAGGNLFVAELGVFPATDFIYRQTGGADAALTTGQAYGDDQPHLGLDRGTLSACLNRLYSPWLNTSLANFQSNVANSTNSGAAMTSIPAGDNSTFPNRTTRIALAPDGKAYIIYKTREGAVDANFENAHFFVRRSDDCGATWTANGGTSGVSVHGTTAVTTWFTNAFGNSTKGAVGRARSSDGWIAADPNNGGVYAVFTNRDASGFGQIFVARSTTQGTSFSAPVRVTDGTHHSAYPEIAVAGTGAVGVLYIDFDDSGAHTIFRHHLARSFDNGATWTDEILQTEDPSTFTAGTFRNGFLWGDYEGLTALGKTFYGVFTGASINRATVQQDPIFFTESAVPADVDFYVRDWTSTPALHDNGEEPSTGVWWTVSDVWNRLTNTAGGFNANDQPNHEVAQDGVPNFAFTRIHRKGAAAAGSPDITVSARFMFADYGLGSNYVDASPGTQPTLTFAAGDTVQVMADGAGFQWSLPSTRSQHICLAVEISSPADPYFPELAGRAPGISDPLIVLDNNKAQINMDLPPMSERGGNLLFYALVHNAELRARDFKIHYEVPEAALRRIEGSMVRVIGNPSDGRVEVPLHGKGTFTLPNMVPGENRWIRIGYSSRPLTDGESIPVTFEDVVGERIVNGFTLAPRGAPIASVLRHNLELHRAVVTRMATGFRIPGTEGERERLRALLRTHRITETQYVQFLRASSEGFGRNVRQVLHEDKSKDEFEIGSALTAFQRALRSGVKTDLTALLNAHLTLLNSLDALETMLQKAEGDTDDILQMVRWQERIYADHPKLPNENGSAYVVKESNNFVRAWDSRKGDRDDYRHLLENLEPVFKETIDVLGPGGAELGPYLAEMRSAKSAAGLEKAHHGYLLKLDSIAK